MDIYDFFIEDDDNIRKLVCYAIAHEGYEIEGFSKPSDFWKAIQKNTPRLVLLDIMLPEEDGLSILKRLKSEPHTENIPVIMLTAKGSEFDKVMGLDMGADDYIANPVSDNGKVIGAIIVILDVTERSKREQLRREFTSNVSHELKTPLTSISGFAEIMKSGETDTETVVDFSSSIYDEAQRLITLVTDIIKLSELDENSIQLSKEQVDLFALSEEIVGRLSPNAKKASVTMSISGEHAPVSGARKILDEMIYNLCDNAIKYNKAGGTVDVQIKNDDSTVVLTVRDTGIGIPVAEQERVFERFYRIDKSHSKEVGGTGLGLSIVKHGAIYHNAKIKLESIPDTGTSISIIFNK